MRVTVSHNKSVAEVKESVDRGFDRIFGGLPIGNVEITDVQRTWTGDQVEFSMTARAGFINVPLKGRMSVEPGQVVVELDLPPFVNSFIPEPKIAAAVEQQVRGLLE